MKHLLLAATLSLTASAAVACETVTLGDLSVEHGWSKVTIGAGRPGVFYVSISNAGATDDALVGISTPAAGMPMLHETVVKDGVASMPHAMSIRPSARFFPTRHSRSSLLYTDGKDTMPQQRLRR